MLKILDNYGFNLICNVFVFIKVIDKIKTVMDKSGDIIFVSIKKNNIKLVRILDNVFHNSI